MSDTGVTEAFMEIIKKAVKNQKDEGFSMPDGVGGIAGTGSITLNARTNSTNAYQRKKGCKC
jgi:hypothetical protein